MKQGGIEKCAILTWYSHYNTCTDQGWLNFFSYLTISFSFLVPALFHVCRSFQNMGQEWSPGLLDTWPSEGGARSCRESLTIIYMVNTAPSFLKQIFFNGVERAIQMIKTTPLKIFIKLAMPQPEVAQTSPLRSVPQFPLWRNKAT